MLLELDRDPARRACPGDIFGQGSVGDEAVVAFDAKSHWPPEGEKLGEAHIAKFGEAMPDVAETEEAVSILRILLADEP